MCLCIVLKLIKTSLTSLVLENVFNNIKNMYFLSDLGVLREQIPESHIAMGVSQGREQRGKDWDPEYPGAGRGGQCHHQSCELRVSLQGYLVA